MESKDIILHFLNGDLVTVKISLYTLEQKHLPNRIYFMKDEIGRQLNIQSYRIHIVEKEENEEKDYFDYFILIDPLQLDCFVEDEEKTEIRVKNLMHIIDLTEWLDTQETVYKNLVSFHYDIDCGIKEGLIDDLCKKIAEKRPSNSLVWQLEEHYTKDQPLRLFKNVKKLVINSRITDTMITSICVLYNLEEVTIYFGIRFIEEWIVSLLSNKLKINVKFINEYRLTACYEEHNEYLLNKYNKFKQSFPNIFI